MHVGKSWHKGATVYVPAVWMAKILEFVKDRKSVILEVWAAPGAAQTPKWPKSDP